MSPRSLPLASIDTLRFRAEVVRQIRAFFEQRDFFEVQTPVLSSESMIDQYIDPIVVQASDLGLPNGCVDMDPFYLQTSPEFAMKRLLVAGAEAIYQICPAFRAGERGNHHNPEFTILEWYRVGDDFSAGIELLGDLAQTVSKQSRFESLTYQDAFKRYVDLDPLEASIDQLRMATDRFVVGGEITPQRDDCLNVLLDHAVAPKLGHESPTILTHYPVSQAALARRSQDDPRTCERFELFMSGVELANGYGELCDPAELEDRLTQNNRERVARGLRSMPLAPLLIEAMRMGLPDCSGCALGVDRLVAVLLQKHDLSSVMSFCIENA